MKRLIFFLLIALVVSSSIPYQQVFANHISGQDDVFTWREFDTSNLNSVWCTFDGTTPTGTEISLQCEGGVFSGSTRTGALLIMKVFNKADIRSGALTNVFTWNYDNTCSEASCSAVTMGVMDGAYDYTSLTEPGGFPNNSAYQTNGGGAGWGSTAAAWYFDQAVGGTGLENIFGAGSLTLAGVTTAQFNSAASVTTKGTVTSTATITNALWNESTQSQFTVFLVVGKDFTAATNHYIRPRFMSITNTPLGTMTWNFPETAGEVADWNSSLGYNYQQNATTSDYGYFFSYDPFVPNPPTGLYTTGTGTSRTLVWDAPVFDGYSPIIGYKIERESPVGGGFSTLVANTGSVTTTKVDTPVTAGQVYNYRVSALNTYGSSVPSNESVNGPTPTTTSTSVSYSCPSTTSSFELFIKAITYNSVGLCWDVFNNGTAITGYQINYTTPFGSPTSVIVNNTASDDVRSYLATNLAPATDYSFKVKAWKTSGTNVTNIANATTLSGSFVIGNYTFNLGTNPDHVDWKFTRTDTNSTQAILDVDYTNTITPSCNLEYRFANTNQTYTNMTSSFVDDETDRVTFIFNDVQNEVIKVRCYSGDSEATYMLTQTSYPLIEQLQNFRNGTYGTSGQFGAIDLITLAAIIIGMLGFNRVNAGVGVIFSIILIAAMASLGLIAWTTIGLAGLAVLIGVIAIFSHSREDVTD